MIDFNPNLTSLVFYPTIFKSFLPHLYFFQNHFQLSNQWRPFTSKHSKPPSDQIYDDTEMTFSSQNMNENVDDGHNYYWKKSNL